MNGFLSGALGGWVGFEGLLIQFLHWERKYCGNFRLWFSFFLDFLRLIMWKAVNDFCWVYCNSNRTGIYSTGNLFEVGVPKFLNFLVYFKFWWIFWHRQHRYSLDLQGPLNTLQILWQTIKIAPINSKNLPIIVFNPNRHNVVVKALLLWSYNGKMSKIVGGAFAVS